MTSLLQDVQFAARSFRKSPVFSVVAVLSLALGIGANTAIFTLVDQLILRLLPVRNPEEMVLLSARGRHYGGQAISKLMEKLHDPFPVNRERSNFCQSPRPPVATYCGVISMPTTD